MPDNPRIAVLLATYNGERWLDEQLETIFAQRGCTVEVIANDDGSSDATLDILSRWAASHPVSISSRPNGGAGQNFLHLLRTADLESFDYVAFADQDDVWLDGKLARAVAVLNELQADGYSSNVTAFWEDGRELLIEKSQPQRKFDHFFESAGPGCTFVLTRGLATRLQGFLQEVEGGAIDQVFLHDWLIYCWTRSHGLKWVIDDRPMMRYRQHGSNVLGAATSSDATRDRWSRITSGWYIGQSRLLADIIGTDQLPVRYLRDGGLGNLAKLIVQGRQLRRRGREAAVATVALAHDYAGLARE